jgi:hypothetical protein
MAMAGCAVKEYKSDVCKVRVRGREVRDAAVRDAAVRLLVQGLTVPHLGNPAMRKSRRGNTIGAATAGDGGKKPNGSLSAEDSI